jgi:hypothetical protein
MFDLSFKTFVTAKLVPVLYVVGLVLLSFIALATLLGSESTGGDRLGVLIFAPLMMVSLRVLLEGVIVLFRIAEHAAELVELQRQSAE